MPYLAHKALGDSYKWLLYGDDDTVSHLGSPVLKNLHVASPCFISLQAARQAGLVHLAMFGGA